MCSEYGELGPTSGWDRFGSLGHPANFNEFRVLAALLHSTLVVGVSQTLRCWTEGATYIWQGGHHVGHWPTFLVEGSLSVLINVIPTSAFTVMLIDLVVSCADRMKCFWCFFYHNCAMDYIVDVHNVYETSIGMTFLWSPYVVDIIRAVVIVWRVTGENYQVWSVQYCVQQLCTVRCTHIWTD